MGHCVVELASAEKIKDMADAEGDEKEIRYDKVKIFLFFWFLMRSKLLWLNFAQTLLR